MRDKFCGGWQKKKRLQIIRTRRGSLHFHRGANRDLLVFLSLSSLLFLFSFPFLFLSPIQNDDKDHSTRVDAFHGMGIEMKKLKNHRASIFHPQVLMPLRLNVPENLRHEQLAHYFTSMWILACIEFPIRTVGGEGVRVCPGMSQDDEERGRKNTAFYFSFSRGTGERSFDARLTIERSTLESWKRY